MEFKTLSHDEFYQNVRIVRDDDEKHMPYANPHNFGLLKDAPEVFMVFATVNEQFKDYWYSEDGDGYDLLEIDAVVAMAEIWNEGGEWTIASLAVRTDCRNQGLSKKLIAAMVQFFLDKGVKHIKRTQPSEDGLKYSFTEMTRQLDAAGIKHKSNRDY